MFIYTNIILTLDYDNCFTSESKSTEMGIGFNASGGYRSWGPWFYY